MILDVIAILNKYTIPETKCKTNKPISILYGLYLLTLLVISFNSCIKHTINNKYEHITFCQKKLPDNSLLPLS